MKVSGDWLFRESTQDVLAILTKAGFQAYVVGGCVRNALLGAPVSDIDISTDALPETVIELAQNAGMNAIPTGINFGTVTVIYKGQPHEITTFRRDIETDGRRVVVAFSRSLKDDALRRDFTMNALYATAQGALIDPLNGLPDLDARRLRFIENAEERIKEDYLRVLRFFRFYAWYGDPDVGMDADTLSAISNNLDGLSKLSKERVGSELRKLLSAADPAPSVAAMRHTGVLQKLLVGVDDKALAPLIHFEQQTETLPEPMRRLAVLGGGDLEAALRLSKKEARHLQTLLHLVGESATAAEIAYRESGETALSVALLRAAIFEVPLDPCLKEDIQCGILAAFPVSARDLKVDYQGAALGVALRDLETRWIASGFKLSKSELLGKGPI